MSFTDRDKILMQVQKPTRYTGGEVNICKKIRRMLIFGSAFVFLMFMRWQCRTWE